MRWLCGFVSGYNFISIFLLIQFQTKVDYARHALSHSTERKWFSLMINRVETTARREKKLEHLIENHVDKENGKHVRSLCEMWSKNLVTGHLTTFRVQCANISYNAVAIDLIRWSWEFSVQKSKLWRWFLELRWRIEIPFTLEVQRWMCLGIIKYIITMT